MQQEARVCRDCSQEGEPSSCCVGSCQPAVADKLALTTLISNHLIDDELRLRLEQQESFDLSKAENECFLRELSGLRACCVACHSTRYDWDIAYPFKPKYR